MPKKTTKDLLKYVILCLCDGQEPDVENNYDFDIVDKYVDEEIAKGNIVKHSEYDFTGNGCASMINKELIKCNSIYSIEAVKNTDKRLKTKIKGQGVYFILKKNYLDNMGIIFDWSCDLIRFHELYG
jgi:hypothetical protein